jgi:oligopeptide/dipeptide ABC transporter ATP-binding protein
MSDAFIALEEVSKRFAPHLSIGDRVAARLGADVETRPVQAVEQVSLTIGRGETLGLVGESGCGKTTLGRIVAGIMPPSAGRVAVEGRPVMSSAGRKLTTRIQTVFQDPFASLDPRMRVAEALAEGPLTHGLIRRAGADDYVARWLAMVGLPRDSARRYPHQFSGGQRQRIAIARALAMQPDVLVCDEPVASLDVSIQAQIINLFLRLKRELDLTMLFISHDLSVVRHLCDRVAIMYLGRIVEIGPTREVYAAPQHPYTAALMAAVPKLGQGKVSFVPITGEIPSPLDPPQGCPFHPRCPYAFAPCPVERPLLTSRDPERAAACHLDNDAAKLLVAASSTSYL